MKIVQVSPLQNYSGCSQQVLVFGKKAIPANGLLSSNQHLLSSSGGSSDGATVAEDVCSRLLVDWNDIKMIFQQLWM